MQDFRNLKVWEKAHALTLVVYRVTGAFPQHESFGLRSHMRRTAFEIPCRIAEACGKLADSEVSRLVHQALGRTSELEYVLLLAKDLSYLPGEVHAGLERDVVEVRRMLTGLSHKVQTES